jgi:hypothetical protein
MVLAAWGSRGDGPGVLATGIKGRWSWRHENRGEMVLAIKQTCREAEEMQVLGGYTYSSSGAHGGALCMGQEPARRLRDWRSSRF